MTILGGLQNHYRWWLKSWNSKTLAPWKKSYDQPRQLIKNQRCYFTNKGPSSQSYGFSSSLIWMWELDYKENWVPKNWCIWTVVLEKTLESPLDRKEIKPVLLKEISPEYSLEGLMLKLQYSGHQRTDSLEKILMLGKTEGGRRGRQRMRWLDAFTDVTDMSLSKPGVLQSMGSQSQTRLSEWTDIPCLDLFPLFPLPPLSLWVVFSSLSVCLVICYQMPGTANFYLRYFYIPINILSFVMRYSYLESLILSGLAFMFCLVEQSSL